MWAGDIAYNQWGNGNYNDSTILFQKDAFVTVTVNAGDLIPVTFMWVNTMGDGAVYFNILDVDTSTDVTDTTGYFLAPLDGDGFSEPFISEPSPYCPGQNGQTLTVGGNPYFIQCDTSYAGKSFDKVTATSLTDCFTQCNGYQGVDECASASYDDTSGDCYFSVYGSGDSAPGIISGTSEF